MTYHDSGMMGFASLYPAYIGCEAFCLGCGKNWQWTVKGCGGWSGWLESELRAEFQPRRMRFLRYRILRGLMHLPSGLNCDRSDNHANFLTAINVAFCALATDVGMVPTLY